MKNDGHTIIYWSASEDLFIRFENVEKNIFDIYLGQFKRRFPTCIWDEGQRAWKLHINQLPATARFAYEHLGPESFIMKSIVMAA